MKDPVSGIKQYFDHTAIRFDRIYSCEKPLGQRLLDRAFRKTVGQRFELIMDSLPKAMAGWSVLDVGTGSGRYAVELADRGAMVTGIDFASQMLDLARHAAERRGVADRCRWLQGDFMQLADIGTQFDVTVAIGFFDYIRDPAPLLTRMVQFTRNTLYASFPKRWTLRTGPRKLRLSLNGCFVRFYSRREIALLLERAERPARSAEVISVNRDYLLKVVF
ncbi:MAG: class I SAM-dependent methyltransferase [Desulfobacteraceae bacterium]|nr:MAG: class I SAM-dependent methyltransferase [Desulfobacteraceae bacterium]